MSAISSICEETYLLDPTNVFSELGSSRILNTYMLGALAGLNRTPLNAANIRKAIGLVVKSKLPNADAFQKGFQEIQNCEPIKSNL
jgi:Pyruvate/2-oxoacid:ferredoxin oxidoreductase gamma subunit